MLHQPVPMRTHAYSTTRWLTVAALLAGSTFVAATQNNATTDPMLQRAELVSPWLTAPTGLVYDRARRDRSCLDLVLFEQVCGGAEFLSYGNRIGANWDVFAIWGGRDSRTRMVDLGQHDWGDTFAIPEIEPWSELKPGETRGVAVNASGATGQPGAPGSPGLPGRSPGGASAHDPPRTAPTVPLPTVPTRREDLASAPVSRQVTSTITMSGRAVRNDYTPFYEVKNGHMYLVRVVDSARDHYVLLRVDDVTRGEKVSVSFVRLTGQGARPDDRGR